MQCVLRQSCSSDGKHPVTSFLDLSCLTIFEALQLLGDGEALLMSVIWENKIGGYFSFYLSLFIGYLVLHNHSWVSHLPMHGYLSQCSIAVKKHHDKGNSCKRKPLRTCLQFQRLSPLLSWKEAWQHTGRNGEKGTKSNILISWLREREKRERWSLAWAFQNSHPLTYFLPQGHIS